MIFAREGKGTKMNHGREAVGSVWRTLSVRGKPLEADVMKGDSGVLLSRQPDARGVAVISMFDCFRGRVLL